MRYSQRIALSIVYGVCGLLVYLNRGSLPAYSSWAAAVLVGLGCWEFEPILTSLLGKARPRNPMDDRR